MKIHSTKCLKNINLPQLIVPKKSFKIDLMLFAIIIMNNYKMENKMSSLLFLLSIQWQFTQIKHTKSKTTKVYSSQKRVEIVGHISIAELSACHTFFP